LSRRLRVYVAATVLAAAVVLALCAPHSFARDWGHYVAWVVICLVSETMWSNTQSGTASYSLSATAGLSSAVLWGVEAGIWITVSTTLIADVFVQRKPWVRAAFNSGQIALATWLGATLFQVLGGRAALPELPGGTVLDRAHATALMLPFVGLVVGYYAVNRAMVALAVAWSTGRSWWQTLIEDWLYMARIEVDAASFLLTPLMVISFTSIGYPGVLLFYAPLFMLFQSDRRYGELKRAEEVNLRNARFAAKGELAAGIGHELNNQLVAISGRAQMLLRDAERQTFDKAPHHAQIILDQSKRMGVLAKGLMDYTRSKVNLEAMDLNGMLTSTIEFVKSDKRFHGVEWDVQLEPDLPQVRADAGQIQGVFINLFVNAADAMGTQESRRAIRVSTKLDARTQAAEIVVQDTGPGIKREHLARMFEFMFTTKPEGHGFGLSTSHRTIENHGGKITVDSAPGDGARFQIELPLSGPGSWH
jgi:signal transduction histidine kinase